MSSALLPALRLGPRGEEASGREREREEGEGRKAEERNERSLDPTKEKKEQSPTSRKKNHLTSPLQIYLTRIFSRTRTAETQVTSTSKVFSGSISIL
jgi:hypothetical protein